MRDMDKSSTKQFVKAIVNVWEDSYSDPAHDVECCQRMIETFTTSADPVLDDLRKQMLDMQLLFNQAQSQLLTYCQRQVAEMNQNQAQASKS